MKHIVALLITLCLLSLETKAQQTLSFPDVDAIGYSANSASIELYTAIGHNQYRTRSLRTNKKVCRFGRRLRYETRLLGLYRGG